MIMYLILLIFIIGALYTLKPLLHLISLKIKLGNKGTIKYFPFIGFLFYDFYSQRKYDDPYKWVEKLMTEKPDVEYILTNFFFQPYIIMGGIAGIKDVWIDTNAPRLNAFPVVGFMERGLNFVGGHTWKAQRSLLSKAFTFDALSNRTQTIISIADQAISELPLDQNIDTMEFAATITSETIIQTFFGDSNRNGNISGKETGLMTRQLVNNLIKIYDSPYFVLRYVMFGRKAWGILPSKFEQQITKSFNELRLVAQQTTQSRISEKQLNINWKPQDFLDVFLENEINDEIMEEIIQNFFTFFVAGVDTTAHLLMYSFYYLGLHQDIQIELRNEIKNVIQMNPIGHGYLKQLPKLQAFINEVLRIELSLNSFTPRICQNDQFFGQVMVKQGWLYGFSARLIHMNPKHYDNPNNFDISRWLDKSNNNLFIAFSSGARNCIGQHLGQIEAKIVLIRMLQSFNIILTKEKLQRTLGTLVDVRDPKFIKLHRI